MRTHPALRLLALAAILSLAACGGGDGAGGKTASGGAATDSARPPAPAAPRSAGPPPKTYTSTLAGVDAQAPRGEATFCFPREAPGIGVVMGKGDATPGYLLATESPGLPRPGTYRVVSVSEADQEGVWGGFGLIPIPGGKLPIPLPMEMVGGEVVITQADSSRVVGSFRVRLDGEAQAEETLGKEYAGTAEGSFHATRDTRACEDFQMMGAG